MTSVTPWTLVLAAGTMLLSCSTADPPSCPDVADQCPEGCDEYTALLYDQSAGCLQGPITVSCQSPEVANGAVICVRRTADGALFLAMNSNVLGPPGWSECSDDETAEVQSASPCQ